MSTQSGIPSFSRPADPRPRAPEARKLSEYRPVQRFGVRTYTTGWVETEQFHEDCGICVASGAHAGPHVWMGLPEH